MLGRAASPGAKGLLVGPLAHIGANLSEDGLRARITDPVDGTEVDPRNTEEMRTGVDLRGILTGRRGRVPWWRGSPWGHGRWGRGLEAGLDDGKSVCNLGNARPELGGVAIEQGERLRQHKQRRLAPRTRQGQGDFLCILFAAVVAQVGQGLGGARSRNDGAAEALPGVARALTAGLRQLDMPLEQGLL
jgi:hypothetical protein